MRFNDSFKGTSKLLSLPDLEETIHQNDNDLESSNKDEEISANRNADSVKTHLCLWLWVSILPLLTWILIFSMWSVQEFKYVRCIPFLLYFLPLAFSSQNGEGIFTKFTSASMLFLAKKLKLRVKISEHAVPCAHQSDTMESSKGVFLVGLHPHGKYPANIMPWLERMNSTLKNIEKEKCNRVSSTPTTMFSPLLNTTLAQSSLGKMIPTISYPTMMCGVMDVTRKSICAALERGQSVALFPGGAREMILCEPFSKEIKIMKRSGFLRLAWEEARKKNDCKKIQVLPVFLFGMNDDYMNPLHTMDKLLFEYTGINLPLWFPTAKSKQSRDKVMVVGTPLDPLAFQDLPDLISAYYFELQKIFDTNKHHYSSYADRSIKMVDEVKKDRKKGPKNLFLIVSAISGTFFVVGSVSYYERNQSWFLTSLEKSSQDARYSSRIEELLQVHIIFAAIWIISAGIQFSSKKRSKVHKIIGLFGIASAVCLNTSAISICLARCDELIQLLLPDVPPALSGEVCLVNIFFKVFHVVYVQLFANLCLSLSTSTLVFRAIQTLLQMEYKLHGKLIKRYHLVLVFNLMPRIITKVLRYAFPFVSSELNYTFAVFIAAYIQWKMLRENRYAVRRYKYHLILSMLALLIYPFFECLKQHNVHFMSTLLIAIAQIDPEWCIESALRDKTN